MRIMFDPGYEAIRNSQIARAEDYATREIRAIMDEENPKYKNEWMRSFLNYMTQLTEQALRRAK
jgi:hypothetical protein